MLLHLGKDVMVRAKDVIFIIDYEYMKNNKINKKFLENAINKKNVKDLSNCIPKSLVIVRKDNQNIVYLSSISSITLCKRANLNKVIFEK